MKVKKSFLWALTSVMAVCMLFLSVGAVSVGDEVFEFVYEQKEITVSGDLDSHKAELIARSINGEAVISPFNLACIFGHNLTNGAAIETLHRQHSTAPRCVRNTYNTTHCSRSGCNYLTHNLIASVRILCCS